PLLADRGAAREPGLDLRDLLLTDAAQHPVGHVPRLLAGVAGDGVQADAVAQLAALGSGEGLDPVDLLLHGGRRLPPGEVDIAVLGSDLTGDRRGSTEVDLPGRGRDLVEGGVLDRVVAT